VLLVDTSAWIEVFRRQPAVRMDDLGDLDRLVTCLPVIQEVLQGFDDDRGFDIARTALFAMPCLESPLTSGVVDRAVEIYRRARRSGVTIRSSVDCLIAACASRHHATVVHYARDYPAIARVVTLEQIDLSALARRKKR
jgi:predicted nucleic acid-binding protein